MVRGVRALAVVLGLSAALTMAVVPAAGAATPTALTGSCKPSSLALKQKGALKVATGDPAFPPWVENDKPTSGKGFEAALVYAVAEQLGIPKKKVSWTRTGFDQAIAPGDKSYDFNVQQFRITADREKVVSFSDGYYQVQQTLVGRPDNPIAQAKTVADLKSARLGAVVGTTGLDYIEDYIKPDTPALVFDDNAAAKAAFDANQVDSIVFDLPTAYNITSSEIEDSSIVGVLPKQGSPEELGFLFAKGSKLVPCVNKAFFELDESGVLATIQDVWLTQNGKIPTLTR